MSSSIFPFSAGATKQPMNITALYSEPASPDVQHDSLSQASYISISLCHLKYLKNAHPETKGPTKNDMSLPPITQDIC